jgi:hypothetical protein
MYCIGDRSEFIIYCFERVYLGDPSKVTAPSPPPKKKRFQLFDC